MPYNADNNFIESGVTSTTTTLKQNSITKNIPILLCIESLEEISVNKIKPSLYQGYLIKPIQDLNLQSTIEISFFKLCFKSLLYCD